MKFGFFWSRSLKKVRVNISTKNKMLCVVWWTTRSAKASFSSHSYTIRRAAVEFLCWTRSLAANARDERAQKRARSEEAPARDVTAWQLGMLRYGTAERDLLFFRAHPPPLIIQDSVALDQSSKPPSKQQRQHAHTHVCSGAKIESTQKLSKLQKLNSVANFSEVL